MNRNEWFMEWTGMNDSLNDQGWMIQWMNRNCWLIEWTGMNDAWNEQE